MSRSLRIRAATLDDEAFLLRLRNDPETRRQSLNSGEIKADSHAEWFRTHLASPAETRIFIAEADDMPVGQARIDRRDSASAEISVAVAAAYRGRGVGRDLIVAASKAGAAAFDVTEIIAVIKAENAVSLRAFAAAGYSEDSSGQSERVRLLRWRPR